MEAGTEAEKRTLNNGEEGVMEIKLGYLLSNSRGRSEDTREGARNIIASRYSHKTRRPSKTNASCGGPKLRDVRRKTGQGGTRRGRKAPAKKHGRVIDVI